MTNARAVLALLALSSFAVGACASHPGGAGSGAGASATTSSGTHSSGSASGGGARGSGGSVAITPTCNGAESGSSSISTSLPPLPALENVQACSTGNAVDVTFNPLDPAVDYRIYPLPADADIAPQADGTIVVKNAIYRCAGHREGLYMLNDIVNPENGWNDNSAGGATVQNGVIEGFTRAESDAQLGYVFTAPATGLTPVYAIGSSDPKAEGGVGCGRPIFYSTRPKTYTTDTNVRDMLVAAHGRDDGIAFYVPAAGSGTRSVYEGKFGSNDMLRWIDGPEGTMRGAGTKLFDVLTAPAAGAVPLMRVHEVPYCSDEHDELVAGTARYAKARSEGDQPITALRWAGLTGPTVLVVEALDQGCPYQGDLSPQHQDAFTENFGTQVLQYEAFLTLADMAKASPTGEVFVNGQYDGGKMPKAIARSFIKVGPAPASSMDFHASFPDTSFNGTFGAPTGNVYGMHWVSPTYELSSYNNSHFFFGSMLGEAWFAYNDIAADVNGKMRLTPQQMGTLAASTFLHVTTQFDIVSTARRYPQILISDQVAPVQDNLPKGTTLIVQPKDFTPTYLQVQVCDHRTWDVNNQCPLLTTFVPDFAPPVQLPGELTGTDNAIKLDVWVSTQRIYVMMNDQPYSCIDFPSKAADGMRYSPPSGAVTVTWGDVLYHSAVDFAGGSGDIMGNSYLFHRTHMHKTTRRHFDNLGFSSGVPQPTWNETLNPCVVSM